MATRSSGEARKAGTACSSRGTCCCGASAAELAADSSAAALEDAAAADVTLVEAQRSRCGDAPTDLAEECAGVRRRLVRLQPPQHNHGCLTT